MTITVLQRHPLPTLAEVRSQWWAPGSVLPVCPTKALLGLDCPGCGGMRVVYSHLHGDVGGALRYNARSVVAVAMMVGAWVALPVVLVWLVVRKLSWAPFQALYV